MALKNLRSFLNLDFYNYKMMIFDNTLTNDGFELIKGCVGVRAKIMRI